MSVFTLLIVILAFIVVIGILNEKIFHMQSDIAVLFFSLLIALFLLFISRVLGDDVLADMLGKLGSFGFEEYLIDGVLCFMLFSGAGKVNLYKFRENIRAVSLLAFLTTLISSFIYGLLFYGIAALFHIDMNLWTCVLLGCVVSPTDPIAATGILNKIGLSKNVCSVIENESLFNDGTGVVLFIFVRGLVVKSQEDGFAVLMVREVLGAFAIALIVSFLFFQLMKLTHQPIMYICISLLDVSIVYLICEKLGCSGVIASVVCGMYFSWAMGKMERRVTVIDPDEQYKIFWEIVESLLNSILFVMIGILVLNVSLSRYAFIVIPAALVINIIARVCGVSISSILTGTKKLPGNYNLGEYVTLMSWSALKGGLSLALALGTEAFLPNETYLIFLNVTYATIFFTVLVQGLTVKKAYLSIEKHKAERMKKNRELKAQKIQED